LGVVNYTPGSFATGRLISGTDWATEVTNPFTAIQAAWTSYTPTWSASTTNPTLGNGTMVGFYDQVGKTVDFVMRITFGTTTTAGTGNYTFSLPVGTTGWPQGQPIGIATMNNTGIKPGQANINSSSDFYVIRTSTETLISGAGAGAAWASTNYIYVTGRYETA
jgi:hypothetical protein